MGVTVVGKSALDWISSFEHLLCVQEVCDILVAMAGSEPPFLSSCLICDQSHAMWPETEERGIASVKSVHKMGDNS